jgi:uncharacterized protein Veg
MERKLSYSYADLITRNVELTVHKKIWFKNLLM